MTDFKSLKEIQSIHVEIIGKDYLPLHRSNYNILAGNGGVGKSLIALKSLVHFLIEKPNEKALAIFSEDTKTQILERLAEITRTLNISVDEVINRTFFKTLDNDDDRVFVSKERGVIVENSEYILQFKQNLKIHKVGYIILDPLERFHNGLSENDESEMKYLVTNIFQKIAVETATAILVLHHTSKGDKSGARGSGVIVNKGRVAYNIRKNMVHDKSINMDVVVEGWESSVLLSTIKDNHYVARWCKIIQEDNGKLELPVAKEIRTDYKDVNGYMTGSTITPSYEATYQVEETPLNTNPLLTLSHTMAKDDFGATKGFKVTQIALNDLLDFISDVNVHYSPAQWIDGYRKGENYISGEDCIVFDIDDGMSLSQAKEIFSNYIGLIITTKSHQKDKNGVICDRFRVIIPYKNKMNLDADLVRDTKILIYKAFSADEQVANLACKFRGSPMDAEFIYLNGTQSFDWESYYMKARNARDKKKAETEARRIQGVDFSDLDDDKKIKAMTTKFHTVYSDGNRNNAVADIVLFGKSMSMDSRTIITVVDGLVRASGNPIGDKELNTVFKYHLGCTA